jgi:hypothetical protein
VKGLRHKDDAGIAILDIIEQAERISAHKTTNFQADNSGEFRNKILEQQLRCKGICMKETVPRHSETNPVIERTNRTIVTMARTALIASDLRRNSGSKLLSVPPIQKIDCLIKAFKEKRH